VECIEALTVILAVGAVLGWRGALLGAGLALGLLLAAVAIVGPALTLVPVAAVHLGIGALLLTFGLRWLRKAALRAAGVRPMRDENAAYARQTNRFRALGIGVGERDRAGLVAAFQITIIEGIEVVFIVLAVGAADRRTLLPASLGALVALLVVVALGAALHRPIARIPENPLKFIVGVLTCAFGIFWIGEGVGAHWPGDDWAIPALAAGIFLVALVFVRIKARRAAQERSTYVNPNAERSRASCVKRA
jgi:Ca2+/H+ antiporter, TMEM165/GDT1 family